MILMETPSVLTDLSGGPIARLTVNRPESLNALNQDVLQSLLLTMQQVERDEHIRVVVITGKGEKSFVAGADIKSMSNLGSRAIADYVELGQRATRAMEMCRVPVIAAVNGFALGGGLELALACDLIIASRNAKLGQPEVNLGIIPGFGGTQRLIHRCGVGAARRLTYTGELISADEGYALGLVDKVVEASELSSEVDKVAETIASKAPLAIEAGKKVIRCSQEPHMLSGLRLEVESFLRLFDTGDREEGMQAFLEKRRPEFRRR
jgi:enoyl-CoA hydratase